MTNAKGNKHRKLVKWQLIEERANTSNTQKLAGKTIIGDIILDTGALHHMTGNVTLLTEIKRISPCSVNFADGNSTLATHIGLLSISDKITLNDVLFVPNLNSSLISFSRLLK